MKTIRMIIFIFIIVAVSGVFAAVDPNCVAGCRAVYNCSHSGLSGWWYHDFGCRLSLNACIRTCSE